MEQLPSVGDAVYADGVRIGVVLGVFRKTWGRRGTVHSVMISNRPVYTKRFQVSGVLFLKRGAWCNNFDLCTVYTIVRA